MIFRRVCGYRIQENEGKNDQTIIVRFFGTRG